MSALQSQVEWLLNESPDIRRYRPTCSIHNTIQVEIDTDENLWFVAREIVAFSGYQGRNIGAMVKKIPREYKDTIDRVVMVNEKGFYFVLESSRKHLTREVKNGIEAIRESCFRRSEPRNRCDGSLSEPPEKDRETPQNRCDPFPLEPHPQPHVTPEPSSGPTTTAITSNKGDSLIYIVTNRTQRLENRFKIGHIKTVSEESIKSRLSGYNTGMDVDLFEYLYLRQVHNADMIDTYLRKQLEWFKNNSRKENVVVEFNLLVEFVDGVCDHFEKMNESVVELSNNMCALDAGEREPEIPKFVNVQEFKVKNGSLIRIPFEPKKTREERDPTTYSTTEMRSILTSIVVLLTHRNRESKVVLWSDVKKRLCLELNQKNFNAEMWYKTASEIIEEMDLSWSSRVSPKASPR
jgi:hypothetical protein